MIRMEWEDFKQLLSDSSIKFRVIEEGKDTIVYALDDWLEFMCVVPTGLEELAIEIKNKKIKTIKVKT